MNKFIVVGLSMMALVLTTALAGCGPTPEEQRVDALKAYVDAERATIPGVLIALSDTMSGGSVFGEFTEDAGPDQPTTAVVRYTYNYLERVEFGNDGVQPSWMPARPSWAPPLIPYAVLDKQKVQLQSLCQSTLFPALRNYGVTGPLRIEYVYLQPTGEVSWDLTCTDRGL